MPVDSLENSGSENSSNCTAVGLSRALRVAVSNQLFLRSVFASGCGLAAAFASLDLKVLRRKRKNTQKHLEWVMLV